MTEPVSRSIAPGPVRAAALLLAAYGLLVLANAAVLGRTAGLSFTASVFPRAILRFLALLVIATGLLRLSRWAWWLAVILGGLWLLMGVAGLVALTATGRAAEVLPDSMLWLTPIATVLLAMAMALLVLAPGRTAFGIGAAPAGSSPPGDR